MPPRFPAVTSGGRGVSGLRRPGASDRPGRRGAATVPLVPRASDVLALRGCVLAVSVLEDLDLEPRERGLVLDGDPPVSVGWPAVRVAIGRNSPESTTARRRLADWLRLRRLVADLGGDAAQVLRQAARAVALPAGHAAHPGRAWVMERPLGGALECGLGVFGLLDDPDAVMLLPPGIMSAASASPRRWWGPVREHAEGMGHLAVQRLRRDAGGRQAVLRPIGGVDVPSLLMAPALRRHLAAEDGSGMRALAVPMRSRGWYDLARIDPAFVAAAWSATEDWERAYSRPLLVTAEEVTLAPGGGDAVRQSLSDPAAAPDWRRDVRYR